MTWNYRVIYHDEDEHPYYGLHEVYYNEDSSIASWTKDSFVVGDDQAEILSSLKMMVKDVENHDPLVGSSLELNIKDW